MILQRFCFLFLLLLMTTLVVGQDVIPIKNPSFEGDAGHGRTPPEWYNCGPKKHSPPDLHSGETRIYEVDHRPSDGELFLGMVVRDVDTYESISQRLITPLSANKFYKIEIDLCKAKKYIRAKSIQSEEKRFVWPSRLRIWGGEGYCNKMQLLGQSPIIKDTTWKSYMILLAPKLNLSHINLEVFYETPTLFPYNGNLLLDNCSPITQITKNEYHTLYKDNYLIAKSTGQTSPRTQQRSRKSIKFIAITKDYSNQLEEKDYGKFPLLSNITKVNQFEKYRKHLNNYFKKTNSKEINSTISSMRKLQMDESANLLAETRVLYLSNSGRLNHDELNKSFSIAAIDNMKKIDLFIDKNIEGLQKEMDAIDASKARESKLLASKLAKEERVFEDAMILARSYNFDHAKKYPLLSKLHALKKFVSHTGSGTLYYFLEKNSMEKLGKLEDLMLEINAQKTAEIISKTANIFYKTDGTLRTLNQTQMDFIAESDYDLNESKRIERFDVKIKKLIYDNIEGFSKEIELYYR